MAASTKKTAVCMEGNANVGDDRATPLVDRVIDKLKTEFSDEATCELKRLIDTAIDKIKTEEVDVCDSRGADDIESGRLYTQGEYDAAVADTYAHTLAVKSKRMRDECECVFQAYVNEKIRKVVDLLTPELSEL